MKWYSVEREGGRTRDVEWLTVVRAETNYYLGNSVLVHEILPIRCSILISD